MNKFLFTLLIALTGPAHAASIAETFRGTWEGTMTAVTPFDPEPEVFAYKMICRDIAGGVGSECTSEGRASVGPLSQSCLVAYDVGTESVHYMCVSSFGEVHDHSGKWKNESTIEYAPYEGYMGSSKVTEYLETRFPSAGEIEHSSRIKSEDGTEMSFTFRARRT